MWRSIARVPARMRSSALQQTRNFAAATYALRSHMWVPTEKEVPADAAIPSHQLLIRGGFIRKSGHGVFTFLPFGTRVVRKLEAIIDAEMAAIRGNKLALPLLIPAELWQQSGRWQTRSPELMTLTDRRDAVHALAPTHEESITSLVAQHFHASTPPASSLRLYQIGSKFRDEIRPRFGLLRAREFVMKDLYTFDTSYAHATATYNEVLHAYHRILSTHLQLPIAQVEADSGSIGGNLSHEFHVLAPIGEDALLSCASATCDYAANVEKAIGALRIGDECEAQAVGDDEFEQLLAHLRAIADAGDLNAWKELLALAALDGDSGKTTAKRVTAVVLRERHTEDDDSSSSNSERTTDAPTTATRRYAIVLTRKDRDVNPLTLKRFFADDALEVVDAVEAAALDWNTLQPDALTTSDNSDNISSDREASILPLSVFLDDSLAIPNVTDTPIEHVTHCRVSQLVHDMSRTHEALGLVRVAHGHFRTAQHGDLCACCNAAPLEATRGIEVGHVFYLGTKYSKPFNATFSRTGDSSDGVGSSEVAQKQQQQQAFEMGCYGMGVTRLVAAAVEVSHDAKGIVWPVAIAPYKVVVLAIGAKHADAPLAQAATSIASDLASGAVAGLASDDVMLDDRWRESPGSLLAESELLGFPFRVVVGKRFATDGLVEVQTRATLDRVFISPSELPAFFADKVARREL